MTQHAKWVVFDMGGVILPSPFETLKNLGFSKRDFGNLTGWTDLEKGLVDVPTYIKLCHTRANLDVAPFFKVLGQLRPHPWVVHCIARLREQGYRIGCITNNFEMPGHLGAPSSLKDLYNPNIPLFDVVVESWKEGCRKGRGMDHRRIFDIFIAKAKKVDGHTTFSDCTFIDDITGNLEAPAQLGMRTFHCTSPEETAQRLIDTYGLRVPHVGECPESFQLDAPRLFSFIKKTIPNVVPKDAERLQIQKFAFGQSNPTYLLFFEPLPSLRFEDHAFVLRKQPPGKLLPSAHDIKREYQIMDVLQAKSNVPVPAMLTFCDDTTVAGTAFYIMKYISGKVYADPMLTGVPAPIKRKIYEEMIRVLASIHSVPLSAVNFIGSSRSPEKFLQRQLKTWTTQYVKSKTQEITEMNSLMRQLNAQISLWKPAQWELGLVHGDFRIDNMIFDHDSHECLAVVDWELASCGGVLTDLITCLMAHPITPVGGINVQGGRGIDYNVDTDIPKHTELIKTYAHERGIAEVDPWRFQIFTAVQLFRLCGIVQGIVKRRIQGIASGQAGTSLRYTVEAVTTLASVGLSVLQEAKM